MAIEQFAQMAQQISMAVQQVQPVTEQTVSILQSSAMQLLATSLAVVGCIKVRYGKGSAVELIRGSSAKAPDGATKVASKKHGDKMGTEAGGTIERYHDCNSMEVDANGWPYATRSTGKARELPYDYIS